MMKESCDGACGTDEVSGGLDPNCPDHGYAAKYLNDLRGRIQVTACAQRPKRLLVIACTAQHFVYWCQEIGIRPDDRRLKHVRRIDDTYGYAYPFPYTLVDWPEYDQEVREIYGRMACFGQRVQPEDVGAYLAEQAELFP